MRFFLLKVETFSKCMTQDVLPAQERHQVNECLEIRKKGS